MRRFSFKYPSDTEVEIWRMKTQQGLSSTEIARRFQISSQWADKLIGAVASRINPPVDYWQWHEDEQ